MDRVRDDSGKMQGTAHGLHAGMGSRGFVFCHGGATEDFRGERRGSEVVPG